MATIGITGAAGTSTEDRTGTAPDGLRASAGREPLQPGLHSARRTPVLREDFASPTALEHLQDCDAALYPAVVRGVLACAHDPAGSCRVSIDGTAGSAEFCHAHQIPLRFCEQQLGRWPARPAARHPAE